MIKKIIFIVLLIFPLQCVPGIFDILSEEMKKHVEALQTLPDEIQTLIVQQWLTKKMITTQEKVKTLSQHVMAVTSITWNPNGTKFVSTSSDGAIRLWTYDGIHLEKLSEYANSYNSLAWNYKNSMLFSAGFDGRVSIWTSYGYFVKTFFVDGRLGCVLWNHDGTMIALVRRRWYGSTPDNIIRIRNADGVLAKELINSQEVCSLAWNNEDTLIAAGNCDGTISILNLNGDLVRIFPEARKEKILQVLWNHDGTLLASVNESGTVELWRLNGTLLKTFSREKAHIPALAWNPKETLLAMAFCDGTIRLWMPQDIFFKTLPGDGQKIRSLAWSPDGTILASGSSYGIIKLWNFSSSLLDFSEWDNLTLQQALLLRYLYEVRYQLIEEVLQNTHIQESLNVFLPATRQRICSHYRFLHNLLTKKNFKPKELY